MTHGVSINEVPTGVRPPVRVTAGLPVYIGTAPINDGDLTCVNVPRVYYKLEEAEADLGPVSDPSKWSQWTLHEVVHAHFDTYAVGPIVCIQVLDPDNTDHVASATGESHQLVDGKVKLQVYGGPDEPMLGILKSTVVVKVASVTKTLGTDYTLDFDADGFLVVTRKSTGSIPSNSSIITADFDYLDPSGVVTADVVGGYSAGSYKGVAAIDQVYPRLRLVPGLLLAPGFSHLPEVAAALSSKAHAVNGAFRALAVCDLSTDSGDIPTYADAGAWKADNGFDQLDQVVTWPKVKNGSNVYHSSTVFACLCDVTDAANAGVPFVSPINKALSATAAVNDDGDEILLDRVQANSLNDQGIVTVLNGFFGWRLWGNRTAAYPGTTDVKDAMIPVRRMFTWIDNTIVLTADQSIDAPVNRRLVDGVVGTMQSFFNALIAQGALVDGKIEFRSDENTVADLSDGKVAFHNTLTPPSPAEEIEFITEYDPAALAALFTST